MPNQSSINRRAKDAGVLFIEASAISELANNFTGTSEDPLWSPKDLGEAINQYAINRKNEALRMLEEIKPHA